MNSTIDNKNESHEVTFWPELTFKALTTLFDLSNLLFYMEHQFGLPGAGVVRGRFFDLLFLIEGNASYQEIFTE